MYNSKLLTEKKAALDWTQLSSGIISQERRQGFVSLQVL